METEKDEEVKEERERREIVIFKIDTRQRRRVSTRLGSPCEGDFTRVPSPGDDCMTEMVLSSRHRHMRRAQVDSLAKKRPRNR